MIYHQFIQLNIIAKYKNQFFPLIDSDRFTKIPAGFKAFLKDYYFMIKYIVRISYILFKLLLR